ncbi:hypothetical protein JCM10213v2_008391 [Rhodosporidiobolus nylandii]
MPSLLDLPDELLVQVIEDAVPTAMGSRKEYSERCRTLRAVALTSKRLHAVALPLLYRVLRVTQSRFRSTWSAREAVDGPTDLLSFAVAAAPRVSDLRIYYCEEAALVELQAFSALTSLTLHDIFNSTALDPEHVQSLRSPHVVDLSLDFLSFTRTGWEAFLSSATFPSLKHLSLGWVELDEAEVPTEPPEELVPLVCPVLLGQLRTLRCWHSSHPSDFSFPHTVQVLHNASIGTLLLGQPPFTRLPLSGHLALLLRDKKFPNPGASRDRNRLVNAKGALEQMTASLSRVAQGAGPSLKLVLLESALLTGHNVLAGLKPAMDAFLEACKVVGVEVIVQETPQYGFESLISKQFIRWCDEQYGTQ